MPQAKLSRERQDHLDQLQQQGGGGQGGGAQQQAGGQGGSTQPAADELFPGSADVVMQAAGGGVLNSTFGRSLLGVRTEHPPSEGTGGVPEEEGRPAKQRRPSTPSVLDLQTGGVGGAQPPKLSRSAAEVATEQQPMGAGDLSEGLLRLLGGGGGGGGGGGSAQGLRNLDAAINQMRMQQQYGGALGGHPGAHVEMDLHHGGPTAFMSSLIAKSVGGVGGLGAQQQQLQQQTQQQQGLPGGAGSFSGGGLMEQLVQAQLRATEQQQQQLQQQLQQQQQHPEVAHGPLLVALGQMQQQQLAAMIEAGNGGGGAGGVVVRTRMLDLAVASAPVHSAPPTEGQPPRHNLGAVEDASALEGGAVQRTSSNLGGGAGDLAAPPKNIVSLDLNLRPAVRAAALDATSTQQPPPQQPQHHGGLSLAQHSKASEVMAQLSQMNSRVVPAQPTSFVPPAVDSPPLPGSSAPIQPPASESNQLGSEALALKGGGGLDLRAPSGSGSLPGQPPQKPAGGLVGGGLDLSNGL